MGLGSLLGPRLGVTLRDSFGYRDHRFMGEIVETLQGAPEAWDRALDASDLLMEGLFPTHTVHAQMAKITELKAADRTRQQADYSDIDCCTDTTEETIHWQQDPLGGLHCRATRGPLAAVLRLDFIMASHFVYSLLSITGLIPASKALAIARATRPSQISLLVYFTLQVDALTWWNAHVKTTTTEAAHAMPWAALKKMMTDKYCPRGEIKKIETEMWNLKVKGTDVVAYSRRFQQLALMCSRMFPEEIDKVEKYIGGLPDMILGSAEKKRKYDDLSKNNQNQQQQNKRQNTGQAYTAGNSDRKPYTGSKPLCSKCDYNHEGPCPPRCNNCKKVCHLAKDCRSRPANANNNNLNNNNRNNNNRNNNNNNQKGNGCYDCVAQGHFKRNCLKNNDRGNQAGNDRAPAKVYVVRNAGANPDNVVA
ncbi:putative reverse transcriptase domain-containing protein, partial [Tanacetum coccineum]